MTAGPPGQARYVIVGNSGSGKSTFARQLAQTLGVRYIELDQLYWAPHWTARPTEEFVQAAAAATEGPAWVADGNYSAVRELVWSRATHVVWLNFSRPVVFSRVVRRTLLRLLRRERLWGGNRETFARTFLSRDSIILWSISTYRKNRDRYRLLQEGGAYAHLQWHELRTPAEAARFLREVQRRGA